RGSTPVLLRGRSRAARPSPRVDRTRPVATPVLDGWPSPRGPRGPRGTEPGVQPDSSAAQSLQQRGASAAFRRIRRRRESGENAPPRRRRSRPFASSAPGPAPWNRRNGAVLRRRIAMKATLSLGRVAGIRIGVHWSVLVIFGLIAVGLAAGRLPDAHPGRSDWLYAVAGVATAVLFLLSLLAHELSHAIVARRNGVASDEITLWLLGGVARLKSEAPSP